MCVNVSKNECIVERLPICYSGGMDHIFQETILQTAAPYWLLYTLNPWIKCLNGYPVNRKQYNILLSLINRTSI